MKRYHDKAIKIERLLRKINKHDCSFFHADIVECYPLAAFSLFFGTLSSNCPRNRWRVSARISKTIDEIMCCIGRKSFGEEFCFESIERNLYIKGENNSEIIDSIIKQMIVCYNSVYRDKIRYY